MYSDGRDIHVFIQPLFLASFSRPCVASCASLAPASKILLVCACSLFCRVRIINSHVLTRSPLFHQIALTEGNL